MVNQARAQQKKKTPSNSCVTDKSRFSCPPLDTYAVDIDLWERSRYAFTSITPPIYAVAECRIYEKEREIYTAERRKNEGCDRDTFVSMGKPDDGGGYATRC